MNKEMSTYETYLDRYKKLTYRNVGVSMLPMLKQGRDLFTIQKKGNERCRKYDVVLYRRSTQYVLHRVVQVREKDYVILGDNCESKEYGITDEDILGVLVSFLHKGKEYQVTDWNYRVYSHLWYYLYPVRRFYLGVRRKAKRLLRGSK